VRAEPAPRGLAARRTGAAIAAATLAGIALAGDAAAVAADAGSALPEAVELPTPVAGFRSP
jgi:hypothetical protein